jgi:hypothetical protein
MAPLRLVTADHVHLPMPAGDEARARAFYRVRARLGGNGEATAPCTPCRPRGRYVAI